MLEEPFNKSEEDIARMTDAQIVGLYGRPRDPKTGIPKKVETDRDREIMARRAKRKPTPDELKREGVEFLKMFGVSQADAEARMANAKVKGL